MSRQNTIGNLSPQEYRELLSTLRNPETRYETPLDLVERFFPHRVPSYISYGELTPLHMFSVERSGITRFLREYIPTNREAVRSYWCLKFLQIAFEMIYFMAPELGGIIPMHIRFIIDSVNALLGREYEYEEIVLDDIQEQAGDINAFVQAILLENAAQLEAGNEGIPWEIAYGNLACSDASSAILLYTQNPEVRAVETYVIGAIYNLALCYAYIFFDPDPGGDDDPEVSKLMQHFLTIWRARCVSRMAVRNPEDVETTGAISPEEYEDFRRYLSQGERNIIDPRLELEMKHPHQAPREVDFENLLWSNLGNLNAENTIQNLARYLDGNGAYNIVSVGFAGLAWLEILKPYLHQFVPDETFEPILRVMEVLDIIFKDAVQDPVEVLSRDFDELAFDVEINRDQELYNQNYLYRSFYRTIEGLILILMNSRNDLHIMDGPINEVYYYNREQYDRFLKRWLNLLFSKLAFIPPGYIPEIPYILDIDDRTFFRTPSVIMALSAYFADYPPYDIIYFYEEGGMPSDLEEMSEAIIEAVRDAANEMANEDAATGWSYTEDSDQFIIATFNYAVGVNGELIRDGSGEFTLGNDESHLEPPPDFRLTNRGGDILSTEQELDTDFIAHRAIRKLVEEFGVNGVLPDNIVDIVDAFTRVFGEHLIWGSDDGDSEVYSKENRGTVSGMTPIEYRYLKD